MSVTHYIHYTVSKSFLQLTINQHKTSSCRVDKMHQSLVTFRTNSKATKTATFHNTSYFWENITNFINEINYFSRKQQQRKLIY